MIEAVFDVPADHPAFPGHFPGRPIVPGALLLAHALHALEAAGGPRLARAGLSAAKFLAPVGPDTRVRVCCDIAAGGNVKLELFDGPRRVATAALSLCGSPPAPVASVGAGLPAMPTAAIAGKPAPTKPAPVPATPGATAEWARRPERSNAFWLRVMTWISLTLGRTVARAVLAPIAAYFLAFAPRARCASRAYLRRALGREPRLADLYRHFFSFAAAIHDRLYLINDRFDLFDIDVAGEEVIRAAIDNGQGVFLLGAHLGSFEALRALGRDRTGLRVVMVMYEENARRLNDLLAAINPAARADIVALGRLDSMLAVRDRLDEGALVGMLGDRTLGDEATHQVSFLGAPARLPLGPLRLAAMLRRPVIFMTGLYLGGNRYRLHFEPLADFSALPAGGREAAVRAAVERYAARLEAHCRSAPYNWFNFHDFWLAGGAAAAPPASRAASGGAP